MSNNKLKHLANKRQWYNITTEGEEPTIYIYDAIGSDLWDGYSPKDFRDELNAIAKDSDSVTLRINSPGGIVSDGYAIYNAIKQSGLNVTAYVDGLAASAASFILMAADKIYIPPAAEIMIHDVWGFAMGNAKELRQIANQMDSKNEIIINIYAERTGMDRESIKTMMGDETWMNGEQSVDMGFADELVEDAKIAACAFDLEMFDFIPEGFKNHQKALQKRSKERAMRDAGSSRSEAARSVSDRVEIDEPVVTQADISNALKMEIEKCLK